MRAPLPGQLRVTQLFGSMRGGQGEAYMARHVVAGRVLPVQCKGHAGVDFNAQVGTPVYVMKGGTVAFHDSDDGYGALGLHAIVTLPGGETHWYAHLSAATAQGEVGTGQVLGRSGATGNVSGPHLHVAMRPAAPDYQNGFDGFEDFLWHFDHDVFSDLDLSLV